MARDRFAAGPYIAWNRQMKNSCDGFSTRIEMDACRHPLPSPLRYLFKLLIPILDKSYNNLDSIKPATEFNVHSILPYGSPDYKMYLASHFQPSVGQYVPFEYYYRLSGNMDPDRSIAIDVDLDAHVWRIIHLNDTDEANKWLGTEPDGSSNTSTQTLPDLFPILEEITQSGTFSDGPHGIIPELELAIQNLDSFVDSCFQEPFLRVFDTTYDNPEDLMQKKWDNKKDSKVLMRTASFGHGRQRLDMCMMERSFTDNIDSTVEEGLFVPFAIISAMRLRAWEKDLRDFQCWKD